MPNDTLDPAEDSVSSPADLAARLERLPEDEGLDVFRGLPLKQRAEVLLELDPEIAGEFIRNVSDPELAQLLQVLAPNVGADLLGQLPPLTQTRVLAALPPEFSGPITALLRYAPDTAGGIMDNRFISVGVDQTVGEVLARIQNSREPRSEEIT